MILNKSQVHLKQTIIMKKVILSLVFVLATGMSFMNANSTNSANIIIDDPMNDCAGQSLNTYNFLEAFTGDWRYAFRISEQQLSECLNDAGY